MDLLHNLLKRQLKKHFGADVNPPLEWQNFLAAVNRTYQEFDADRKLVENSLELSSQELFAANSEIRAMFQALPDLVLRLDHRGNILSFNAGDSAAGAGPADAAATPTRLARHLTSRFQAALRQVGEQRRPVSFEYTLAELPQQSHFEARLVPLLENQIVATIRDITERRGAEAALAKAQRDLLEASRLAGMAEVATGVLHNVGNVLNSVNVTSTCLAENLQKSKAVKLSKVVAVLRAHEADLGRFLTTDPQGVQVVDYLARLATQLANEQAHAVQELAGLQKHIDHIKDIVAMQQSFANGFGLAESVQVTDLVEDALRLNEGSLTRHEVEVIKEFADVPAVTVDKHKVLQILINLVTNAKQACDATNRDDKRLTLRVLSQADRVQIAVADNGVGIPPENLTRIFNHGFTTKKNGHGFGLHSGAIAAKEMGGTLRVHSDGVGRGTVFTLELPVKPTRLNHA